MAKRNYILPHQQQLISSVELALEEIKLGGNSHGMLYIGPTGIGKTHGVDRLAERYPVYQVGAQTIQPCLRINTQSVANASAIIAKLMSLMNRPINEKKSYAALEGELFKALAIRGVRLVVLEELHNALRSADAKFRGQINRFLKNIWNIPPEDSAQNWAVPDVARKDHRIIVVATGTEELLPVFHTDKELRSRFSSEIKCEAAAFFPPERFKQFRFVFRELTLRFNVDDILRPDDNALVSRCLIATEGHLRQLESLIQRSASLRRRGRQTTSALELMTLAAQDLSYDSLQVKALELDDEAVALHIQREMLKQR